MKYVDLTLPTPEHNLACDEALFHLAENGSAGETLRLWEPAGFFVVLGHSRPLAGDVDLDACRRQNIPVLRRFSGGGTVLQGPGCLNYTLVLDMQRAPELSGITSTNRYVMARHQKTAERLAGRPVEVLGHTDLAIDRLKFSGNAQRRGKRFALFHGTFLLSFDIEKIGQCLPVPDRQPDYRKGRPHDRFLTNLELEAETVKKALRDTWNAQEPLNGGLPAAEIDRLAQNRYASHEWNSKF